MTFFKSFIFTILAFPLTALAHGPGLMYGKWAEGDCQHAVSETGKWLGVEIRRSHMIIDGGECLIHNINEIQGRYSISARCKKEGVEPYQNLAFAFFTIDGRFWLTDKTGRQRTLNRCSL